MGRAIKKKWFTAKAGSTAGNLALITAAGTEAIIKQVGTGVYEVASGRVKLVDGGTLVAPAPGVVGTATLEHDGRFVKKINQFVVTYFDDNDAGTVDTGVWNDGSGNIVGTLAPLPISEGEEPGAPVPAQATATGNGDGTNVVDVIVTDGGAGYYTVPDVTIASGAGTGAIATATIFNGVVTGIDIDNTNSAGYVDGDVIITIDPPVVVAAATTKKTKKSKK